MYEHVAPDSASGSFIYKDQILTKEEAIALTTGWITR